jgi:glycosyltransferase involved in cell wall biosynthesis
MPAVMSASDVVVLTSDNEGTPVSLIEAQAAGLPVVSTDVGGVSSAVVDGRTGRLVEPDDERGFAVAVEGFLADPGSAREFGARGREHVVERFSIERLIADVDELYRGLGEAQLG